MFFLHLFADFESQKKLSSFDEFVIRRFVCGAKKNFQKYDWRFAPENRPTRRNRKCHFPTKLIFNLLGQWLTF